jgi:hypothetical protein
MRIGNNIIREPIQFSPSGQAPFGANGTGVCLSSDEVGRRHGLWAYRPVSGGGVASGQTDQYGALFQHVQHIVTRVDGELGEEQCSFIEGCPAEWEELPEPAEPLIWHGNVFRALQIGEDLEEDLDLPEEKNVSIQKMLRAVREFNGYITANENYIVNYGDRYRNGEIISTAFVESTVNEVISKRFVKRQQMRWTNEGAHRLLQVRMHVLNDELKKTFFVDGILA